MTSNNSFRYYFSSIIRILILNGVYLSNCQIDTVL